VLGSVLVLLAVTAAVLLVPALVGLLGVERHRHLAETEDTTRRLRLVLAATLVGLASLLVVALAGGGTLAAAVVAVVLAGSVLVWAPLTRTWAVRGVVVWALLVSGAAGFMGWFAYTLATSSPSVPEWLLGGGAWLMLLLWLARLQRSVRRLIAGRSGLVADAATRHTPLLRPAVSLAALLATSGVVVALASGNGGPAEEGRPPQAGLPGTPTSPGVPLPSPSVGTKTTGPGQPTAAQAGLVGVPWSPAGLVAGAALERPTPSGPLVEPTCPTGGTQGTVTAGAGAGAPAPGFSGPQPGGAAPTASSTPKAAEPTGRPTQRPSSPAPGSGAGPTSPPGSGPVTGPGHGPGNGPANGPANGPGNGPANGPGNGPGHGPAPSPTARPTPMLPAPPVASPTAALTRLLGFEKEKPNRPAGAPSPGHGRPDHARTPVLPTPGPPLPPLAPPPVSLPAAPQVADAGKTPGYAKEKPNRPAGAPSPGHGRPSKS
jgi:hypothetical protein